MKWIIFAVISLMSFSLQSHYLLCEKKPRDRIDLRSPLNLFYYNSTNGGLIELPLYDEILDSNAKDLSNPETYTHQLTDENNTQFVFTSTDGKSMYTFNKVVGMLKAFRKNRKDEWREGVNFGYCNFVSTLKLPAHTDQ